MALFNRPKVGAGESYLAELKCGRMDFNADTSLVSPDPEKGLLYVKKSVDNLVHLCWKNRKSAIAAEDWTVFEGDTSVRLIKELPEHRVFFIKFIATGKRMFYWLQHVDQNDDKKLLKQLDMALNKTNDRLAEIRDEKKAKEGLSRSTGIKLSGKSLKDKIPNINNASELLELYQSAGLSLGNSDQLITVDQVLSQLGGKATTPKMSSGAKKSRIKNKPTTHGVSIVDTPKTSKNKPVKMEELQSAMNAAFAMTPKKQKYDLTKILNKESLSKLLADKTIQERLNKHMPEDEKFEKTESEILKTIGSPQYQQALTAFQEAFESGQLAGVLKQFDLPDKSVEAANSGNLNLFAKNLENNLGKDDKEQSSSNATVKEDEKMDAGENIESSEKVKADEKEKEEDKDDMVTE